MATRWALAFVLSAVLALVVTAELRRRAQRLERRRLRAAAGAVIVVATVPGWVLAPVATAQLGIAVGGAAVLAGVGVLEELSRLPRRAGRYALVAATLVAVIVGFDAAPRGFGALEGLLPVGLALALLAALHVLDESDGAPTLVTMIVATGVFALAGFGDQAALACVAVALAGSCCGFLAYSSRPASVFLGEPGALSLAYLLTCLTLGTDLPVGGTAAPLTLALLLAMPLLEAAVVLGGRARRPRHVGPHPRDHLVHRLVARGLGRSRAGLCLVGAQVVLTADAVFVGRGVLTAPWGAVVGLAVLASIASLAIGAPVHGTPVQPLSDRQRRWILVIGAAGVVFLAGGVVASLDARQQIEAGRDAIKNALAAARDGRDATAAAEFADAVAAFDRADDRLNLPPLLVGLAVPAVGENLEAVRDISDAGGRIARAGLRVAEVVEPDRLRVVDGTIPLDEVRRVSDDLDAGARILRQALRDVRGIDTNLLVGPVSDAIGFVRSELSRAEVEADRVAAASRLAPAILGGDGVRHYFLAVQNSAEERATGGFIGNFGILTADAGKVELSDFQRIRVLNDGGGPGRAITGPEEYLRRYGRFAPADTWQNVNMSPDFPTVGQVIASLYPQSGGQPVDGVIAVDPVGLAALLELTGPVPVDGWPVPLTAANVVDVTLRDAYAVFEGTDRADFLGDVAEAAVDRATDGELGKPAEIARVLGRAADTGHISLWFARPEEQALAARLDVAGRVPGVRSDSLLVTTQNAAGNKLDYYLQRDIDYDLRLRPDDDARRARVDGSAAVRLENTVAVEGLSRTVVGPYDEQFVAGENRSYLSVYTPLSFTAATVDGQEAGLESDRELGRNVFSSFLSIPAGESRTLDLTIGGAVVLEPGGWYRLELVRQPGLRPDRIRVSISVSKGWRIAETRGLENEGGRASGQVSLDRTRAVAVRLEPSGAPSIWRQLADGP